MRLLLLLRAELFPGRLSLFDVWQVLQLLDLRTLIQMRGDELLMLLLPSEGLRHSAQ